MHPIMFGETLPKPPYCDIALFLFGFALWSISLFLLHQGKSFQKWVTRNEENAPNPEAGLTIAWLFSLSTLIVWVIFWEFFNNFLGSIRQGFHTFPDIIWNIRDFIPAPFLASIVPAGIGLYKFLISASFAQANRESQSAITRSPAAAVTGAVFTALQLVASIATLIMFFKGGG